MHFYRRLFKIPTEVSITEDFLRSLTEISIIEDFFEIPIEVSITEDFLRSPVQVSITALLQRPYTFLSMMCMNAVFMKLAYKSLHIAV